MTLLYDYLRPLLACEALENDPGVLVDAKIFRGQGVAGGSCGIALPA